MSDSSSISENLCDQFSAFHLRDYDCTKPLDIYKSPPTHLTHEASVQTDAKFDHFVYREVTRCLREATIVKLDYDLFHVSYLLSVKNQSTDLKLSLQTTIASFKPPNPPPTVSSHQRLLGMAEYLLNLIENYEKNPSLDLPTPFCLRFPT
ncbi:uncharacterized protein MELLADRAFT_109088 [Melampsora larici-populina 98AG31]|uniref:Uncharacterized protein n=1 Tax=Melampsora larici-populina (strain 98AG31 / pathotype 3-4-7) TaxID=747676 RepID=F4RVA1_MELLP|nr:uncharacterized protein MELLADRAFT_109088 [Melampsora larici-populina 98AG31]EGG03585.1 hypothetical protein MELLADRAFT_109088 [Melampsora larici-populina 98AG31]